MLNPSVCREQLDTWNILARARNEGRLFSRIEWPKDPEIVRAPKKHSSKNHSLLVCICIYIVLFPQKEQVKRLHLLLTVKDSAANIPKNLEARRRLEFFSNSLFMDMPPAKPVCEMVPFRYTKISMSCKWHKDLILSYVSYILFVIYSFGLLVSSPRTTVRLYSIVPLSYRKKTRTEYQFFSIFRKYFQVLF